MNLVKIPRSLFHNRLSMHCRFMWGLKQFLTETLTPDNARALITARLENRDKSLLDLIRTAVYGYSDSPYLPLLSYAGCEYGDLERLVKTAGADKALAQLADEGVYLSIEEYKGRTPIVRGSITYQVKETDFDNPCLAPQVETRTSGGRGAGTRTAYELAFLADSWSAHLAVALEALGVKGGAPYGLWLPIMPGSGPIVLLAYTKCGVIPTRWFSPLTSREIRPSMKSRVGTHGLLLAARMFGIRWPRPEYLPLKEAEQVARWIHTQLQTHGQCCFNSYTSTAVRVCQAATRASIDLSGAIFLFGGEPLTESKHQALLSAGVSRYLVMYGSMDAGYLGLSCFSPQKCDDVHLFDDSFVFNERSRQVVHAETEVSASLVSSLLPTTPKILLNVETGDWGVRGNWPCSCEWGRLGLEQHMHSIRSFDKLTSEGMTFAGSGLYRLLDEILPRQFGGGAGDYQLVEEEDTSGKTRISIVASPDVGEIDEQRLLQTVVDRLSKGQDFHRMMGHMWVESGTMRVIRERPFVSSAGKVLPLHVKGTPKTQWAGNTNFSSFTDDSDLGRCVRSPGTE